MRRRIPTVFLVFVLGSLAALGFRAFSDPVQGERLNALRKGMTQEEVRSILGTPTRICESGQWTYQRRFVFGFVNIHWQEDGTYDGEINRERF